MCAQVNRYPWLPLLRCCPVGEAIGPRRRQIRELPPEQHGDRRFLPNSVGTNSSWFNTEIGAMPCKRSECLPAKRGDSQMPILQVLLVLIVVGVLLWLVNSYVPMQGTIKSILNAVVVIGVVLWLLNIFGLFHSLSHMRVGT